MATANIGDHISCFLNSDRCSCTDCTGLDPPLLVYIANEIVEITIAQLLNQFWVFRVFYELYVWLYAYSCSILRCFQLINYSFLSVSRFRAKNDCSYSFWVFRLNFMLNFVYTFQAIAIFLTGIVSLILAKLELFFVNFKSISNIKWSYMSGGHMTYCLQIDKIVFFWQFHGLFCQFFPFSWLWKLPLLFSWKTRLLCDVLCDCLKLKLYI